MGASQRALYSLLPNKISLVFSYFDQTGNMPRKVIGNSKGEGERGLHFLKGSMKLNWNFQGVGWVREGVQNKKLESGYFQEEHNLG